MWDVSVVSGSRSGQGWLNLRPTHTFHLFSDTSIQSAAEQALPSPALYSPSSSSSRCCLFPLPAPAPRPIPCRPSSAESRTIAHALSHDHHAEAHAPERPHSLCRRRAQGLLCRPAWPPAQDRETPRRTRASGAPPRRCVRVGEEGSDRGCVQRRNGALHRGQIMDRFACAGGESCRYL